MPWIAGTLQPAQVQYLRCPRCWYAEGFVPIASLTFRCVRCEWPFLLSASTPPSPSVPATTVPYTNASGSPMAVTVTSGTLTSVVINGVQAGTTDGTYYVPVAGTISITYSVAPSWSWALLTTNGALSAGATSIPVAAGGTAFAYGQVLIIDPAGTADVVTVNGTPTGTSLPVTALASSHLTGRAITVAQLAPLLSGTAQDAVPQTAY